MHTKLKMKLKNTDNRRRLSITPLSRQTGLFLVAISPVYWRYVWIKHLFMYVVPRLATPIPFYPVIIPPRKLHTGERNDRPTG